MNGRVVEMTPHRTASKGSGHSGFSAAHQEFLAAVTFQFSDSPGASQAEAGGGTKERMAALGRLSAAIAMKFANR
jgi:hypothetical protein